MCSSMPRSRIRSRGLSRSTACPQDAVKKMMKDTDKARANYYAYHTGQRWGEPVNYHLSIDSGYLEIEDIVDLIIKYTDVKLYR